MQTLAGQKWVKAFFLILFLPACVVLVLNQLWEMDAKKNQSSISVHSFHPDLSGEMTNELLVTKLTHFALANRAVHASWEFSTLSIDLLGEKPANFEADLAGLINFAFIDAQNVSQLLVRIYEDDVNQRRLLVAVDTHKTNWSQAALLALRHHPQQLNLERLPIQYLKTSYGKHWLANQAHS